MLPTPGLPGAIFRGTLDAAAIRRASGIAWERCRFDPTYRLARIAMPACW